MQTKKNEPTLNLPGILATDFERGRPAQAYLIFSPNNTYLDETARVIAKQFGVADVFWLKAHEGASSITVEQTLDFTLKAHLAAVGKHKLLVINDASKMTPQAQNKLLKTLEEIRPDTTFLLLAGSEDKILPTIKSRCITIYPSVHTAPSLPQNKNSEKILSAAGALLECKTLDQALPHIAILNTKENLEHSIIALNQGMRDILDSQTAADLASGPHGHPHPRLSPEKIHGMLGILSQISRNVAANCNATNAFDLLIMELFT